MLEEEKKLTDDPAIIYERCAIEEFTPQRSHFDLVTSSLALHYVEDYLLNIQYVRLVRQVGFGMRINTLYIGQ
jgi:hypothetical protein